MPPSHTMFWLQVALIVGQPDYAELLIKIVVGKLILDPHSTFAVNSDGWTAAESELEKGKGDGEILAWVITKKPTTYATGIYQP